MSTREALQALVDQLPEQELLAAHRYLEFLSHSALEEEPIDEETARDLNATRQERGERITLEQARLRWGS
jgi:cobalamin biosynthesis protein CbiG